MADMIQEFIDIFPLIAPLLLIDIGFKIFAIIDIMKVDRVVRWNNKIIWVLISVLVNYGWIFYFLFGRDE